MRPKSGAALARQVVLAFPETEEREHMGSPSFRVAGKIFAQLSQSEDVVLVKLPLGEQEDLVRSRPDCFSVPAHWAKFGWTYARLEGVGARELRTLLERSWRLIAPKRLALGIPPATGKREP
jgi:hypothetical protein